jgi:hypothetical protein
MAVNCSLTRLNISCTAVVLPTKVALIFRPRGGMSQMEDLTCRWGEGTGREEEGSEERENREEGGTAHA